MPVPPLLTWAEPSPARRRAVLAASAVTLLAIGGVDSVTGSSLSFGVFYVLAVVAVTVVGGVGPGIAAALASAVLWGVADVITGRSPISPWVDVWNGITRFAVHAIVVVLVTALLRALRAARESDRRSRAFLATAAHQLRTPVAALSASAEVLVMRGTNPGQEGLLANIAGEASRLGRLVTSLLRAARLDQGEAPHFEPVDIGALCEVELERRRPLSTLEWAFTIAAGTPESVVLDAEATHESLANVLDNARRHAVSRVEVRVRPDHGGIVVEVTDDGPGLPSGFEQQAFERFVTLDGQGGTGLGLAIARELARVQGGDLIYVRKAFILCLPLIELGRPAAPPLDQTSGGGRKT
jgi:signal transduction histidine kinase